MRYVPIVFAMLILSALPLYAGDGMITVKSAFPVKETADRLEAAIAEKGMTVFNRIDHARGAKNAGVPLLPTELLIFGNPKVGAPLMQCDRSVGIDLPMKALIWEDEAGNVWYSYNSPEFLASRHNLSDCRAVLEKVQTALANFARAAAAAK